MAGVGGSAIGLLEEGVDSHLGGWNPSGYYLCSSLSSLEVAVVGDGRGRE